MGNPHPIVEQKTRANVPRGLNDSNFYSPQHYFRFAVGLDAWSYLIPCLSHSGQSDGLHEPMNRFKVKFCVYKSVGKEHQKTKGQT